MRSRSIALALLAAASMASLSLAADPTVYATAKGKKYHQKNCRLKQGSVGMKLSEAKKKGLTPCAVCKPAKG